jgi:HlyD family secretion protein
MGKTSARRRLIWGGAALAIVMLIAAALAPRPVPSELATVSRGTLTVTLDHEGVTRSHDPFEISAPLAGRVLRIELEPGDTVIANQTVLATFQPTDPVMLDNRTRAEAQARLKAARGSYDRAGAERERSLAEHDLASSEYERIRSLQERGIVSQQELDAAEAAARAAAESLVAAEAAARSARHEVELAAASLLEPGDGTTNGPARTLAIRSPVDGVVLRRLRQSEAIVPAGEPLLEVADLSDLEVVADFLSTDAVRMRPGMPALIERWGGERPLKARVRRVEPAGFMKISALGVEEQRVWVVVDFDEDRERWSALGDGYRVEVRVVVYERDDALKVPTSSLFRHGDGWAVFAVDGDDRARLTPIEIDQRNGLEAEVLSGLEEGERVVIHPPEAVKDGVRVRERG